MKQKHTKKKKETKHAKRNKTNNQTKNKKKKKKKKKKENTKERMVWQLVGKPRYNAKREKRDGRWVMNCLHLDSLDL